MKNLEQIRAYNALQASHQAIKGKDSGEVVKKVPPMIINDGLLAAVAFACQQKDGSGYKLVFQAVMTHLQSLELYEPQGKNSECDFARWLAECESAQLRALTAETLSYLSYLRRFATKEGKDADRNEHRR